LSVLLLVLSVVGVICFDNHNGFHDKLMELKLKAAALAKEPENLASLRHQSNALAATTGLYKTGECDENFVSSYTNVGPCIPFSSTQWIQYSISGSVGTQNLYSDAACSNLIVTSETTLESPNTCTTNSTVGYGFSNPGDGVYFKNYGTIAACNANNFIVETVDTLGCTAFSGSSVKISCTSDSLTVSSYAGTSCGGTASLTQTYTAAQLGFVTSCSDQNYQGLVFACQSSSSSSSSCFAGSETVQLQNGNTKQISQVEIGDAVLSYNPVSGVFSYSPVVSIPHAQNSRSASFVHLETEEGMGIKMTPDHLLPSGVCGSSTSSFPLSKASEVQVGSCVQTTEGQKKISFNNLEKGQGVYTIVTGEEFVVVNGIVASPFAVSHHLPNAYYNLHRFAYKAFPEILKSSVAGVLSATASFLSTFLSK